MAYNVLEKNGHVEPFQQTSGDDIKIIVVGENKCGKTSFIEAFAKRSGNVSGSHFPKQYAKVYPCRYEINSEPRNIKIFEILGGPDDYVDQFTKPHFDLNGIVFMYAIDDPSSFQKITDKWIETLKNNYVWKGEPAVLVGNKRDMRENQQVLQRLAQDNQAPITRQQGESLANLKGIKGFFECSSIDENDRSIHEAFHYIVSQGLLDWRGIIGS